MSLETATQGAALSKPPGPDAEGAQLSSHRQLRGNRGSFGWSILLAICIVALFDWLSAGTERLYVDEDSVPNQQEGTVWQHFGIRGNEVVPEIISRDEARFTFPISLPGPHSLRFTAHPEGAAKYEIVWRSDGSSRTLAAREISRPRSERVSVPAGPGELKFIVDGRIAWFDLRLVRPFPWPAYLAALLLAAIALKRSQSLRAVSPRAGNWLALGASSVLCLVLIETGLRLVALKLPPPILNARHNLGLFAPDPRWIDSPRYRQRLRPNLKTYCEWEHGDIVRMGFIPPELFGPEKRRYPFETDTEGFRNAAVREEIDFAALGDSFVDGMTSPVEETWPARLEQMTGKKVQNYGTSSFGPQQALYVLQDFVIHRKPREVVFGFFAGNDFFDAERFDTWQRAGHNKPGEEAAGWRLTKKFRRYETFYLTTLAHLAFPTRAAAKQVVSRDQDEPVVPHFDRGRFEIPTENGGRLRFAFMPPYLQKLVSSRQELEGSRGWELIRSTLLQMQETCRQQNSRLTVMFIPSKAEVYWPLVARSLSPEQLQRALECVSLYNRMPLRAAEIEANRRAAHGLLRDFCAGTGISFLDLTPALEQSAAAGRAVYFADDAHWNAAGHEVAAQELAKFLGRP